MTAVAAARRHPLLEDVHRIIEDRSCAVLSFDIFDTILWRRVPRPADVFGIIGARLRASGLAPEWVTDATFRRMRIEAEKKSRNGREALGTEVSLFDIWRAMPSHVFDPERLDEYVKAEMEVEREFTVIDLDVAEVIKSALKHDVQVIFVSDTYFTEEHLNYLLDRPELGSLQDVRVFRSHQHGLDKANGLFEVVLKELGKEPEQIVHIGDNEIADYEVPGEMGVRTVLFRRLDDELVASLERENDTVKPFAAYAPNFDVEYGDFGITSLRAKTIQSGRYHSTSAVDVAWRHGAAVLGPVMTGFAEWVAWRAHTEGKKVLWCPMREGTLLSELVNNAAKARGWDVTAKPIWLSRHVTSLAGVTEFDTDSIHEFIRRSYHLNVRQVLSTFGLRAGDVPSLAGDLNTVIDNGGIAERVSIALTETPHIQNRLKGNLTAARERLMLSLRKAGALDGDDITLVDLGWGGTIQYMLAKALKAAGSDIVPAGYYIASDHRAARAYLAGLQVEGYLAQAGHPEDVCVTIVRSPEVFEQCVNALCGSLVGFTEDGSPVLGPVSESISQNNERQAAQDGIKAFQAQWNRYVTHFDGKWADLATSQAAKDRLANILVSALKSPTAQEAAVFGNWAHEDNFGSSVVSRIIPEDLKALLPYLSPLDLEDLHMRDSFWPALLAASDTSLGAAARALASGEVDRSVFESTGEPMESALYYRTAEDKWREGGRCRVRINHNGLSFARLRFEHHDTIDLSLALPGRPAVVRVDWIEAEVIAAGGRKVTVRWEGHDDFAGMTYRECRWLGANMVEFDNEHSALILPIAQRAGGWVTSGQVTVGFAVLPQSTSFMSPHLPTAKKLQRVSGRLKQEYRTRGPAGLAATAARIAIRKLGGNT
jgi:predicted HAD superfamily hydrolase